MAGCGCELEIQRREEGRTLVLLLAINALMFVVELVLGWLAESTALLADSLDMLADAAVYGLGLYAVSRSLAHKARAALVSGWLQVMLSLGVLADVLRRALLGSDPEPGYMIWVGLLALVANVVCLVLIAKHRDGEVHMRASWIFSKNDVIANVGVIAGGALVAWLGVRWPDLCIGLIIAALVVRGGVRIIADARATARGLPQCA